MENGPIVKKGTSKLADSIAQLDVFEENGSKKGSKMAPTLIKPMENHQTSLAGNIFFCMKYFLLYIQKKVSQLRKYKGVQGGNKWHTKRYAQNTK